VSKLIAEPLATIVLSAMVLPVDEDKNNTPVVNSPVVIVFFPIILPILDVKTSIPAPNVPVLMMLVLNVC